jgi:hypothetical protein
MHGNVPVRFGRGRLDSLVTKGLAAYLITSLGAIPYWDETCEHFASRLLGMIPRRSIKNPYVPRLTNKQSCEHVMIITP